MSYKRRFRTLLDTPNAAHRFRGFSGLPGDGLAVISAFEFANVHLGEPVYDVQLLSETGGPIRASMGLSVAAEAFGDTKFDTRWHGDRAIDAGPDRICATVLRTTPAGRRDMSRHVRVRSSWLKQVYWKADVRPRIGTTRVICRRGFQT